METNTKKIDEISIPVPWGHVAAKTWGEDKDPLILCIHGLMDNAGSFDRLLSHLPSSYYYVCIDLPGHGKSSHFPPHLPIHTVNYLLVYKAATNYFKKKFIIMGHSYGGQIGFLYAQLYPQCVIKLIMLETVTTLPVTTEYFPKYLEEMIENHLKIIDSLATKQPPLYTREEALQRVKSNRNYSEIKLESAEALLKRAIEPVGQLYKFTLDQRIKNYVNPLKDNRYFIESVTKNPVKCPILIVLGKENGFQLTIMDSVIKFFKKSKNIKVVEVDGNHDVHNDYPERVAPLVTRTWGEAQDPLIVCVHGIMDNAGTFNRLIPYLPNSFYYVCIDLPGHGRSSHFPPHLPIHTINYVLVYRIIFKYFQKKFIIMAHSYGGQIGFIFAQLYPECIEKLIMLDTIITFPIAVKNFKHYLSRSVDAHINLETKLLEKKKPPSYTHEEALDRLWNGRSYAPIKLEAAKALLERAIAPTEDGKFIFTVDQRLKNAINPLRDIRCTIEILKVHPVRCPVLIVLGSESTAQQVFLSSIIQFLKRRRNIRIKYAEGNHDVHNDSPELVAPYVVKFLLYQKNKL